MGADFAAGELHTSPFRSKLQNPVSGRGTHDLVLSRPYDCGLFQVGFSAADLPSIVVPVSGRR